MAMRDEDLGTALTLTEGDEAIWSPPISVPRSEPRDWQARAEMERARADAAEARAEELRSAEVATRSDAALWKSRFKACRQRLSEAEQEAKDLRRAAKDVPSLQAEVAHLEELLSEARSGSSAFGTIEALREEIAGLQKALASKARKDATGPVSRENARLRKALERSQGQKDEVVALRGEVSARRKSERAAQSALSKESIRLGKALERTQKQKDTIKALREEVTSLTRETRWQNRENGRLQRELEWLQSLRVIEIEVKAHIRRIVRPRYRRGCECASSPLEAIAPPVPRLFSGTLFGTSFWARFLFEHCACLRPLCRVAAWYADQGLPVSPGTLANSLKRFVPLFDPLYEAILAHQNRTTLRHADETGWRVQEFRDTGRSSRAWLWVSVSKDSVYYIIDPSRSAEVAMILFRDTACTVFLVCDRYSAYKTLARELAGKVILCWCWAYVAASNMLRRGWISPPHTRIPRLSAT